MAVKPISKGEPINTEEFSEADKKKADDFEVRLDRDLENSIRAHGDRDTIEIDYSGLEKIPDGIVEVILRERYLAAGWSKFEVKHEYVRSRSMEDSDEWKNTVILTK